MKYLIFSILLLFIACKSEEGSSPEVTDTCLTNGYYVSSSLGNDSNSGTSSCSPWKTLSKVEGHTFSPGDTIYFNKGDTWYEGLSVPSSNLNFLSYGSGSSPIFNGASAVRSWTNLGSNIYSYASGILASEGLGNLSRNDVMLTFISWNTDYTTTLGAAATNSFSYDNSTDTLYLKSTNDPSSDSFRYSKIFKGISADSKSNITISGIDFTRYSLHAVEFKDCSNCDIENSSVTRSGGATIGAVYAGNGIEYGNSSNNGDVNNCTVSEIFDSCLSPQTYSSNQTISNITFKNTTVDKCGFAGVEISVLSNGGSTNSSISNVTIENVTILNSGRGWSSRRYGTEGNGIRIKADNGAGSISSSTVSRVVIDNAIGDGIQVLGNTGTTQIKQTHIRNNSIYGVNFADAIQSTPKLVVSSSIISNNGNYGLLYNCPSCQGINLFHNTFYNNSTISVGVLAQSNEAIIKNNIFYSSSAMTHLFSTSTLSGADVDHNCYNDTTNMFGYNGSAYSTVAAFNGAIGFETNGLGNGTVGLNNPNSSDYSLASSSSCRSLGETGLGITMDFDGTSYLSPPSAGAQQY